jgi:general secretion pathway protein D
VEAGVDLQITPHISEDDFVQMLVNTKVEQFSGPSPAPGIPPPKTSNEIQTEVRVPDKFTIVIGGLTRTTETESVDKVPILGDIPLLGFFFQRTVTSHDTSTLYIFIRSEVLKAEDYADLIELSSQSSRAAEGAPGPEGRTSAKEAP